MTTPTEQEGISAKSMLYSLTLYAMSKLDEGILKPKEGEHKVVTILKKTANTVITPLFALVSLVETIIRIPFALIAFGLSKVLPKAFNDKVGRHFVRSGTESFAATFLLGAKTVTNVAYFKTEQLTINTMLRELNKN